MSVNKFCGSCGNLLPVEMSGICEGCELAIVVKHQVLSYMLGGKNERSDTRPN
jgi:hypothetical protein